MSIRIRIGALALAATLVACERSVPTAGNDETSQPVSASARYSIERGAMDRLASRMPSSSGAAAVPWPIRRSGRTSKVSWTVRPTPSTSCLFRLCCFNRSVECSRKWPVSARLPRPR